MCQKCEGIGKVNSIDIDQLVDKELSLKEGAITVPNFTVDSWYWQSMAYSGFVDPDKKLCEFTEQEWDDFLYKPATKIKQGGINTNYEGLVVKVQRTILSKDKEAVQPHIRAFIDRAVTFSTCPTCRSEC